MTWAWTTLDTWIVASAVMAGMACAVLGNFLVLRKMSMMGDAISHALLPGIVAAFILTGSRTSWPMFVGAACAGILTAWLTEWLRHRGKVDEGAAMGIVFTSLFALGILLLRRYADTVDLDPDCVLNGMLESSVFQDWTRPVPRVFITLSLIFGLNLFVIILFYKELKLSSFDPQLATTLGIDARWMHYLLMSLTALTTVAAFEAVGPILVIAMLIVPPAGAYLLTDRLSVMILLSLVLAALSALFGHLGAIGLPRLVGLNDSTTTVGMMACASGVMFLLIMLGSPRHGLVFRFFHRRAMSRQMLREDVLAILYRANEQDQPATPRLIHTHLTHPQGRIARVLQQLKTRGLIRQTPHQIELTPDGQRLAGRLIRSHRLWEKYLSQHTSVAPDHLHSTAERLEHVTDPTLQKKLSEETTGQTDPHGRSIPGE